MARGTELLVTSGTRREACGAARIAAIFAARSAAASVTQAVFVNLSRRTWRSCFWLLLRRPLAIAYDWCTSTDTALYSLIQWLSTLRRSACLPPIGVIGV